MRLLSHQQVTLAMVKETQEKLEPLREMLHYYGVTYYVEDRPEIPDAEHGCLIRELMGLESRYPELMSIDSLSQRVGGAALDAFGFELPVQEALTVLNDVESQVGRTEAIGVTLVSSVSNR